MVGSKLNLKLLRDITSSPLMFGGIVFLLLVGIALFTASYELYLNLGSSYAYSYRRLNLADFTIPVQSAPKEVIFSLRSIPAVRSVEGRTIEEIEIDQPESASRKVVGRIISIPDTGQPQVNQLKLVSGSYPGQAAVREILLEASFAAFHHYKPGDFLSIVEEGDKIRFRVVGIVQSPEYIYVVRGREYPLPTPRTFGVMWMRKSMVDELFGTAGSFNDIGFTVLSAAKRRTAIRLAERILAPYGAEEAIPQEDQASADLLRQDLRGLQALALFFPVLFLTISSLSVYNMLSRMVHAQRSQIGFLRAVGFSRGVVGRHYASYALIVGSLGGFLGVGIGHYLGIVITRYYTSFVQVPYYDVSPRWSVILGGFALTAIVTGFSGLFPARAAARLNPAEAIGVEVPDIGRGPVVERYLHFLRRYSLLARLPLRNFLRNPRRTISTVAGIASGATLLLVSAGLLDSSVAAINFYFKYSIHYDIMASYLTPQSRFAAERIERWPGVTVMEAALAVPAKLVKGDESQTILIYGVQPNSRLLTLSTPKGEKVPIARTGLMVAGTTARKLHLWEGGTVCLTLPKQVIPEVPEASSQQATTPGDLLKQQLAAPTFRQRVLSPGRALLETRLDKAVRISSVTYQPVGATAYASIGQVREWYGSALELPPQAVNAVVMKVRPAYIAGVEQRLYNLDGITSVEVTRDVVEEIENLLRQSKTFFNIMLAFSIALAGVIIFNSTLMNVIERTREIATLRTLGLSVAAAARMVWVENMLAYAVGIVIGLPFGWWLANRFVQAYQSESFSMQTVIFPQTYAITVVGILLTVALAQIPGIRYIRSIELAKATKDVG
jgi:putative ABC transport system permease protein